MIFKRLQEDIDAFMDRDPAARTRFDVLLGYPGFHALVAHRLGHWLWRAGWRTTARFISQIARFLTGIEIHPGARIGRRFVIDHGAGVVVGETSVIGDDVTLYQGVTLGGVSPSVDSAAQVDQKRHPTLENGVIVGSGAQVLGPIVIGEGARIGANAVVHKDVAPGVTAVGIPARVVLPKDRTKSREFVAYGEPIDGCPDPVLQTLESMRSQMAEMQARIRELEGQAAASEPNSATKATDRTASG